MFLVVLCLVSDTEHPVCTQVHRRHPPRAMSNLSNFNCARHIASELLVLAPPSFSPLEQLAAGLRDHQ